MGIKITRKRIKEKSLAPILPIARLGAEFEWTDDKIKVGLESFPVPKRLISKAELSMVLALNMYYDDIQQKFVPLSAVDISTVRSEGRYYTSPPDLLTVDQYAAMRIDNNQYLLTRDILSLAELVLIKASNAAIQVQTDKLQFDGSNNLKCIYAL